MLSQATRFKRRAAGLFMLAAITVQTAMAAPLLQLEISATGGLSSENTGSSARITFEFIDGPEDIFKLLIENTTPVAIGSKLTGIGFELPDSVTQSPVFAIGGTSSYFNQLTYNDHMSPGWLNAPGGYDLAITSEGNLMGGSPQGAPSAGESQQVTISLGNTPFDADQLFQEFNAFYSSASEPIVIGRFQAVGSDGEGSDKVPGRLIPEPSTLALLAGAHVFFLRPRRRRII